jgi:hypothetical protein
MPAPRSLALALVAFALAGAPAANAAPKSYVFTGKFTSNRGLFINLPVVAAAPCNGVGLSNLTVMRGPGGAIVPAPNTPAGPFPGDPANAYGFGCVGIVAGKKLTTTGAGAGGAFVMPTMVLTRPFNSYVAAVDVHMSVIIQLATSFKITGPLKTPTTPVGGSMVMTFAPAPFHAFKEGRVDDPDRTWGLDVHVVPGQSELREGHPGHPSADREVLGRRQRVRRHDGLRDPRGGGHFEHRDRRRRPGRSASRAWTGA